MTAGSKATAPFGRMLTAIVVAASLSGAAAAPAPSTATRVVELWSEGSRNNPDKGTRPAMEIFYPLVPGHAQPATVVILPGGGFAGLSPYDRPLAEFFRGLGYAAVVVTYRVVPHRHPASFADAARAIRLLRQRADELGIPGRHIALLGGSAGGHLAAMISTQPDLYRDPDDDLANTVSARPDRLFLMYPVISAIEPFAYASFERLLGADATQEMKQMASPERHVTQETPPVLLVHAADDTVVQAENSLAFAQACWRVGVPAELHVFPRGGHGRAFAYDAEISPLWRHLAQDWLARWMQEGAGPRGSPGKVNP